MFQATVTWPPWGSKVPVAAGHCADAHGSWGLWLSCGLYVDGSHSCQQVRAGSKDCKMSNTELRWEHLILAAGACWVPALHTSPPGMALGIQASSRAWPHDAKGKIHGLVLDILNGLIYRPQMGQFLPGLVVIVFSTVSWQASVATWRNTGCLKKPCCVLQWLRERMK